MSLATLFMQNKAHKFQMLAQTDRQDDSYITPQNYDKILGLWPGRLSNFVCINVHKTLSKYSILMVHFNLPTSPNCVPEIRESTGLWRVLYYVTLVRHPHTRDVHQVLYHLTLYVNIKL